MKWIKRFLRKNKQKIDIIVMSVSDYQHHSDISVGSSIELINVAGADDVPGIRTGPDYPPIKIELQGEYTITGLKITINPWKYQKFFKFED